MAALTNLEDELAIALDRFIEFGELLDRKMRKYLVQYIQNKFDPDRHLIPGLQDQYYQYFTKSLDEIFLIEGLVKLTNRNQKIKNQVILDTIYWLRKAHSKVKDKHPYDDEVRRLEGWAITPFHVLVKRWTSLPTFLRQTYRTDQLDARFFADKFKQLMGSKEPDEISVEHRAMVENLYQDLLAQWDALLHGKILAFTIEKLEEELADFATLVENKVTEYLKLEQLVKPFSDYLGWDMSRELWQEASFDILDKYHDILADETSITELAEILGKMREADIEVEEETFEKTIIRQAWVKDEMSRSEIVGVHQSDHLSHLLSGEAGLLGDDYTESLFLKKYVDKKLLTFKYEDRKLVPSEDTFTEVNQRVRQKEKGPFILCVDTSESMLGQPEKIAKVLCLAILKVAMLENRKAFLINFSRGIHTLDLHDIANSLDDVADFLRMSFYGGTDATLAIYEALKQLGNNDYQDADVLMVSDFIMYRLEDDIIQQIKYFQQNKNTQWHSLTLSEEANPDVISCFDTNWLYNPKKKGIIKAIHSDLQDIIHRY